MPYKGLPESKWGDMEKCVEKVKAKGNVDNPYAVCMASLLGHSTADEIREMFSLSDGAMSTLTEFLPQPEHLARGERIAFNIEQFQAQHFAKSFCLVPYGKWYRGDRIIDVTDRDLGEMYDNWQAGLPRYGLSVNVEHGTDDNQPGSVGVPKKLSLVPGKGIYCDETEFTKIGKQLLDEDRYRAVSPEIIWSKNKGAKYQDPKTGKWHDNVIVGYALTTSPFFGQDVAVFSAKENFESPTRHQVHIETAGQEKLFGGDNMDPKIKKIMDDEGCSEEEAKKKLAAQEAKTKEKARVPTPPEKLSAKKEGDEDEMAEPIMTKEEFADLQVKAAQVEVLSAKLKEREEMHDKLAKDFATERQLRRTIEFVEAAEKFSALPVKTKDLGEELLWLYDVDATDKKDHYTAFEKLLTTVNVAMGQSELFSAMGSGESGDEANGEPYFAAIEKVRIEKFSTDEYETGYVKAMKVVDVNQPALSRAYAGKLHSDK